MSRNTLTAARLSAINNLTDGQLAQIFSTAPDGWIAPEWRHYASLRARGIPHEALVDDARDFTFSVYRKGNRERVVFEV